MKLLMILLLLSPTLSLPPWWWLEDASPGGEDDPGVVCIQAICCGSDGITYPSPCDTPDGVTCVDFNECPGEPEQRCPGCGLGAPPLPAEQSVLAAWAVAQLQGSGGACPRTLLGVANFTSQVVAGTVYEFDLVLEHSVSSSAPGCGAGASSRESCHVAVWEKVWEDFREVQWDRSSCIRSQ